MSQISAIVAAIAASQQSNSPLPPLPRILFSKDIARLSGLSTTTIQHYTGNAEKFGHLLPRWFKLPGARRLAWLESDVLAWVKAGQTVETPAKVEQIRATQSVHPSGA